MSVNREEARGKQQENHEISGKKDWQRPELSIISANQATGKTGTSPETATTKPS